MDEIAEGFRRSAVSYALIGGLALGFRGVQRSTNAVDLVVLAEHQEAAASVLAALGFRNVHKDANASTYLPAGTGRCRVDLLHAQRTPSRAAIERSESMLLANGRTVQVATTEDIIAFKLQAIRNDPTRALQDWADISALITAATARGVGIDRGAVRTSLELFGFGSKYSALFPDAP